MIDEVKQDLLVQYLLNEVDASTAEKIRAELEADPNYGILCGKRKMRLRRWPTLRRPWRRRSDSRNGFFNWNEKSQAFPSAPPRSKIIWLVLPWALAACLAVAFVLLGLERTRLQKENEQARQELLALQQKNARVEEELALLQKKNVLAEIKIATLKAQVAAYSDGHRGGCLGQRSKEWGAPVRQIASARPGERLSIVGD